MTWRMPLYIGVHPDFHGTSAHMGNFTNQNDGIIQESCFFKVQIVDGGRRDPALGMTGCYDSCQLVDPHEKLAAEKPAVTIDMPVHQKIRLFCEGVLHMFHFFQSNHPFY